VSPPPIFFAGAINMNAKIPYVVMLHYRFGAPLIRDIIGPFADEKEADEWLDANDLKGEAWQMGPMVTRDQWRTST
jgi:hypothetical protein